jgi:hypothetical protein
MKRRVAWLLTSCLVALSLMLASCAKPATTMPTAPTAPTPSVEPGRVWLDEYTYVVGGDGEPIVLIENPSASNPTWEQLFSFLQDDQTDAHPYTSTYICADFAETLHNNAEAAGIRAAFVALPESDHSLNAFETMDEGLVYIDCTGESATTFYTPVPAGTETFGDVSNWDKVAYIQVGSPLGFISLENARSYGFQYYDYKKWVRDKETFDQLLDEYYKSTPSEWDPWGYGEESCKEFPELCEEFKKAWRESELYQETYRLHEGLLNDLRRYAIKLGGFWEQGDIVKEIKIIWEGK